jgi:sugar O-acyltransferase (sialic acid O-acetyltransferase NeuD family)
VKKLFIIGAGGFGREVHAWAGQHPDCGAHWELAGFLDDNPAALRDYGDFAAVVPLSGHRPTADTLYLNGLALPELKQRLLPPLLAAGAEFLTFLHPTAKVGERVKLGRGVVLCPGAIVTADADLGDFVVLNLRATVGHDAKVGAWTTANAHCDVTGFVEVGEGVFMGSRASIIPGRKVGAGAKLAAGAVVFTDVPPGVTMFGNPARAL